VRTFVWIDSWQQQCCGDEFRVGSTVHWDVFPTKEQDGWVETLLGPDWGAKVRYQEDHHGGLDDAASEKLHGVVRSIYVVTCDRWLKTGPGEPTGGVWLPIPGSGRLRAVDLADPWEPEPPDKEPPDDEDSARWIVDPPPWWFEGWIAEVDITSPA
jgi:hypothetical protein